MPDIFLYLYGNKVFGDFDPHLRGKAHKYTESHQGFAAVGVKGELGIKIKSLLEWLLH